MGPTSSFCELFDRAISDRIPDVQRYEEAARHILDALTLQNSDAVGDPRGGVTSDALWNCLESVCGKIGRPDLISACEQRDLDSEYYLHVAFLPCSPCANPVADRVFFGRSEGEI